MKDNFKATAIAAAVAACAPAILTPPAHAADEAVRAAETRFRVGLVAASGLGNLRQQLEAANPGLEARQLTPVGLELGVYRDFGNRFAAGGSIGPLVAASGDASFSILPLSVGVRYEVARIAFGTGYLRGGIEKAFVRGDLVKAGSAGGVLAAGMDFGQPGSAGWGGELAYRTVSVKVPDAQSGSTTTVRPYMATVSGYYRF